jgi:hypothetical protein
MVEAGLSAAQTHSTKARRKRRARRRRRAMVDPSADSMGFFSLLNSASSTAGR